MSPAGRIHLDPAGFEELAALPEDELRALLALLALAPDGELTGGERKLAKTASAPDVATLRETLARLAARRGPDGRPWLARDEVRGEARLRLSLPDRLAIRHPALGSPTRSALIPASRRAAAPAARSEAEIGAAAAASLRAADPTLADLADAWIAHLTSLSPSGTLSVSIEVRNRVMIERLFATDGARALESALLAGLRNVKSLDRQPERYLTAAVRAQSEGVGRRPAVGSLALLPDEEVF